MSAAARPVAPDRFSASRYLVRRKVLKLFGGACKKVQDDAAAKGKVVLGCKTVTAP